MGGFYGSVQVRGHGREAVLAALEPMAKKTKDRFLVGPELGGWVGVYPNNNGQDPAVGASLAKKLGGEAFVLLVHDDDLFLCVCLTDMHAQGSRRRGGLARFWDYPALCDHVFKVVSP